MRSKRVLASECPELAAGLAGEHNIWEHERIPFPSYPYEWPPEMLEAAASLTLDLAEAALEEGFGLKDATPYNVLVRGWQSVFVDVLSFERREPLDVTWLAYGQFVRTFLAASGGSSLLRIASSTRVLTAQQMELNRRSLYHWCEQLPAAPPGCWAW